MSYYGNEPAKVALKVGSGVITAEEIQDASISTADIANDAITPNQLDDDGTGFQIGTLGIGAAVSGGHALLVSGTSSISGTTSFGNLNVGNTAITQLAGDALTIKASGATLDLKADYDSTSGSIRFYPTNNVLGLTLASDNKATFVGQVQASSFITGDLILKSPINNGHYTIWEEEEYLAIRNELKGKTYKFVLEEIND